MELLRKYGQQTTIRFPLVIDEGTDFQDGPATFSTGRSKVSKNTGSFSNTTNLPAHIGEGIYSLVLTASEMSASGVNVVIRDTAVSGTKQYQDQCVLISTYGHPSGQILFNFDEYPVDTEDVYYSDIAYVPNGSDNEFTVSWFKNGIPVTTGVTTTEINVYRRSDGNLINNNAPMTEVGTTQVFKSTFSGLYSTGSYIAAVSATIEGATRTWRKLIVVR